MLQLDMLQYNTRKNESSEVEWNLTLSNQDCLYDQENSNPSVNMKAHGANLLQKKYVLRERNIIQCSASIKFMI